MVSCYEHVIESTEYVRRLVGGSSDSSFQLNERQCQILVEELVETTEFLKKKSACSKFGEGVGSISLRHLCIAVKRAEVLIEKCCCKDLESWLVSAMTLVEIQEEFMVMILDIHMWRMFLAFAITSRRGLSQEKKVEEMKIMDEEYHELFKDLRRESHALQKAAKEDKGTIISRTSRIVELRGSTNGLDYLRAIYLQSWLTNDVGCRDTELMKYEYVNVLGQGGCATVLKVKWLGVECALKVLHGQDEKEATALKGLFHPNIIRLLHYWEDHLENPKSHLLMELMPQDLGTYMKGLSKHMSSLKMQVGEESMPFSLPVAIDIMYQIAQAMRYMHDKHLTHRDLKPANILVKEQPRVGVSCIDGAGYLDIKLADFGLVKSYTNTSTFQAHSKGHGTAMYRAPEIIGKDMTQKRNYLPMVDVWSFGITCAEILSGKQAYAEYIDDYGLAIYTMISKEGLRPTLPKHCPPYLAFCIKSCWEFLPSRRPTFASLCKLLRHAKLLSLGVTKLDDNKFFFAYSTRSDQMQSLNISPSSSRARVSMFFQSSLKFMGIGPRRFPSATKVLPAATPMHEVRLVPTPLIIEDNLELNEDIDGGIAIPESLLDEEHHQDWLEDKSGKKLQQELPKFHKVKNTSNSLEALSWEQSNQSIVLPISSPSVDLDVDWRYATSSMSSRGDCNNGSREAGGYQFWATPPRIFQDDDMGPSPKDLLMAVMGVKSAVNHFAKVLITHMTKHPVELKYLKETILQEVGVDVDRANHWKFLVQAFICKRFFDGFNAPNGYFGVEYFENNLMTKAISFEYFFMFKDKASTISMLLDLDSLDDSFLGKFCFKKFKSIFVQLPSNQPLSIYQEEWDAIERERHPKTVFYQSFLKVAVSVWLLHRLVYSFEEKVEMLIYENNAKFQRQTMESVLPESYKEEDEEVDLNTKIGFSVIPGFQVNRSVVKCEVYLCSNNKPIDVEITRRTSSKKTPSKTLGNKLPEKTLSAKTSGTLHTLELPVCDKNSLRSLWSSKGLSNSSHYVDHAAAPRAPTDRDLQAAFQESSTGVQQSCHGHYDLAHYYLKGKQAGESHFSADYVGPVIVTDVGRGRGRGLVLTKDVEAGELLLVSNPMAFLALQDVDQTRRDISLAFVDGKVQEGFRHVFETAQHKGLEKLPTLCDGVKSLPAPSVHQTDAESGEHELHLDHARVRRIIQLNAVNGDATMGWKNLPDSGEQDKVEHWGLWWLPSFINHSCLPSSSPILVGKALFVFAARDLRAGEEVTRAYFDIFQPLDQRKELSAKGWSFVCYCPRCKLEDALHSPLSKVTEQYTKLMELASKSKSEFGTDEQLSDTQSSAALKFFHKLESKLKDFKLNAAENNWVRSSFLHYIDMISGDHELHTHLESIVEALVTVCPGSETTLHMAVVAKDSARRTFGKKSAQFEAGNHRALNICRFTYGKQKASVLQSIVDKNDYQP